MQVVQGLGGVGLGEYNGRQSLSSRKHLAVVCLCLPSGSCLQVFLKTEGIPKVHSPVFTAQLVLLQPLTATVTYHSLSLAFYKVFNPQNVTAKGLLAFTNKKVGTQIKNLTESTQLKSNEVRTSKSTDYNSGYILLTKQ